VVHGKGRPDERFRCLTMSAPAIAAYLRRGRPGTTRREVPAALAFAGEAAVVPERATDGGADLGQTLLGPAA
jgi:hypothetical protein